MRINSAKYFSCLRPSSLDTIRLCCPQMQISKIVSLGCPLSVDVAQCGCVLQKSTGVRGCVLRHNTNCFCPKLRNWNLLRLITSATGGEECVCACIRVYVVRDHGHWQIEVFFFLYRQDKGIPIVSWPFSWIHIHLIAIEYHSTSTQSKLISSHLIKDLNISA